MPLILFNRNVYLEFYEYVNEAKIKIKELDYTITMKK